LGGDLLLQELAHGVGGFFRDDGGGGGEQQQREGYASGHLSISTGDNDGVMIATCRRRGQRIPRVTDSRRQATMAATPRARGRPMALPALLLTLATATLAPGEDLAALASPRPLAYAELPDGFAETVVARGLTGATAMAVSPDGRVFICEQTG